ncbi:MAG: calcium:proton antiporter [Filomicrobium sp.]
MRILNRTSHAKVTRYWSWSLPTAAALLLLVAFSHVVDGNAPWLLGIAAILLVGTVFAAVHHAEVIALRVGQPFGSILLAIAVTVIEVALIVSIMLSSAEYGSGVARDTVFASMMIVLNGVVGLCLLAGGLRYHEQDFQVRGASGAFGVIGTLATLALILPNYTHAAPGPLYAPAQLVFVTTVSLALYGLYLFVQSIRHREYFLDSAEGSEADQEFTVPGNYVTILSAFLLVATLACVILLAELLSSAVKVGVAVAGLPPTFIGVVIATLVLMPEGLSAFRSARDNRLQTSLNLALGSALASIGLTIPAVSALSLLLGTPVALGLEAEHIVLLVLTLFAGTLTLATGRTTVLQGGLHLVIFGAFLTIEAVP